MIVKFSVAFFFLLSAFPSPVRGTADQFGSYIEEQYDQDDLRKSRGAREGKTLRQLVVSHDNSDSIGLHFLSLNIEGSCVLYTESNDNPGVVIQKFESSKFNNSGELWAFNVGGSAVKLTLECSSSADADNTRFTIDKYAVTGDTISTAAICGDDEKVNAICYKNDLVHPDIYENAKKVCRLIKAGMYFCTAWLVGVSDSGYSLVMTNAHCISSQSDVENSSFQFMAENPNCDGPTGGSNSGDVYAGKTLLSFDTSLDYALMELEPNSAGSHAHEMYGHFELDVRPPVVGETIYIPQHAGGRMKQLAITDTNDESGVCTVKSINGDNIKYTCDTEGGSSGSPVVSYDSNKIIGLHKAAAGGCNGNIGTMVYVLEAYIANDLTPSSRSQDVALVLLLITDGYPKETSLDIKNSAGEIYYEGSSYDQANNVYRVDMSLPPGEYQFQIRDYDGICCAYGSGGYSLLADGEEIVRGGEFSKSETKTFNLPVVKWLSRK